MKKILVSSALAASLLCVSNAQSSGLFVGVNAGVPYTVPTYSGALKTIKSALPESGIGWAVGLDVGYKQALSEKMGLKYYLSYNYNESKGDKKGGGEPMITKVKANITQQLITANVDYYYNFTSMFGAYIGVGVGYQQFKPTWTPTTPLGDLTIGGETKGGLAVPLNIGLNFNVNDASQITLGAKIPLVGYDYKSNVALPTGGGEGTSGLRTYIVQVGYNFTF